MKKSKLNRKAALLVAASLAFAPVTAFASPVVWLDELLARLENIQATATLPEDVADALAATITNVANAVEQGVPGGNGDDTTPGNGDETPGNGDETETDETPVNGDDTTPGDETETDETPVNGDETETDETPVNGDETETDETPVNGDDTTPGDETETDETPVNGDEAGLPFTYDALNAALTAAGITADLEDASSDDELIAALISLIEAITDEDFAHVAEVAEALGLDDYVDDLDGLIAYLEALLPVVESDTEL